MKSNKRKKVNLSNFMKFKDAFIPKFDNGDEVHNQTGLRYFMKSLEQENAILANTEKRRKWITVFDL